MAPKTPLDNGTAGGEPSSSSIRGSASGGGIGKPFLLLALLSAALFCLRLAAPPNLLDQDQERPASYVLDAVRNGHWLCQRDFSGEITSKPPLWTWLSAATSMSCGRVNLFTLYLPGALAAMGTAWLVFAAGRKHLSVRAGWFGAVALLVTTAGVKEVGLARTDGVFAFLVTASALLAFRAWTRGGGWTSFWLLAALATLTKGPLGVVLAAGGLLACAWERKLKTPRPVSGSHWLGLVLFVLLVGGWFALAYGQCGRPLVDKMLGRELVAHAVSDGKGHWPGRFFYQQTLYYLGRAAPWSLLAFYGFWRIWRGRRQSGPDSHPEAERRRFERFLFCWFGVGLAIFSLAPHQRADLLWPIMPAGALVAGSELARLTRNLRSALLQLWIPILLAAAVGGFACYYFGPRGHTPVVRQTEALRALAEVIKERGGAEFPLTHVDDPITLQVYLNTFRPPVSVERAARLLRGPEAAFVAVRKLDVLQSVHQAGDPPFYTVLPAPPTADFCPAVIVGNRHDFAPSASAAFCSGPLLVRVHGALVLQASEQAFEFKQTEPGAEVLVTNESLRPEAVRVVFQGEDRNAPQHRTVAAGETWRVTMGRQP